ncbi:hypothetical protein TSUD_405690 [Trifolium subterraneum]|uniref:Uncharacterized protein n=1 Tax=Trifolium subterraneum TaxID=3900 RepID=A0A2Z6P238_TRISU|nr:hypothetical protein TSUD_405690 [Trifolium subterraneum]
MQPPVPFQPPPPPLENDTPEQEGTTATITIAGETVPRKGPVALLQGIVNDCLKRLFYPNDVHLLPEVNLQRVSLHLNKHIIAFISGPNQVLVRDYEDPASARSGTVSFVGSLSRGSGIRYLLVDFLQSQNDEHVSALTWSPDVK